jgi:outer membrane protein TolC
MFTFFSVRTLRAAALAAALSVPVASHAQELTLIEAEQLALEQSPWIKHHTTNRDATGERVVYEGRLPDPQLTLGAVNVPTDTWSFKGEDMTMTQVGLRQAFPPGDTLALKSRRAEKEVEREHARLDYERRALRRNVRQTYLELYYAEAALRILEATRVLASRDVKDTEARFRAAQETERATLRARQNLARVIEREPMLRAQLVRTRTQLARWIGKAAAERPLPAALPGLPVLPDNFDLGQYPELIAAQANLDAARAEVDIQKQEYRPGVMLDVMYGFRQNRSDMMTALVSVDLPVFRAKRQDRKLAEKQAMAAAAKYEQEDKRRDVESMYQTARAEYEAATLRAAILSEQLLPSIQRETQGRLAGFAREQAELREARMKELEAELDLLRARVDAARLQAELLYLMGETS